MIKHKDRIFPPILSPNECDCCGQTTRTTKPYRLIREFDGVIGEIEQWHRKLCAGCVDKIKALIFDSEAV